MQAQQYKQQYEELLPKFKCLETDQEQLVIDATKETDDAAAAV